MNAGVAILVALIILAWAAMILLSLLACVIVAAALIGRWYDRVMSRWLW